MIIVLQNVKSQRGYRSNKLKLFVCSLILEAQGCTDSCSQVSRVTNIYMVTSSICGFSVWYVRHVTFMASRILRGP